VAPFDDHLSPLSFGLFAAAAVIGSGSFLDPGACDPSYHSGIGASADDAANPANERIIAILAEEQVRRWKAMTGESARIAIVPFGSLDGRT
jgi:hypothetical protein